MTDLLDDPNPGIIGAVYDRGVWISLEPYVPPPPPKPRQRSMGAGSLFYAPSAGLWVGQVQLPDGQRTKLRRVTSKTFCGMLRKFSAVDKPEGFDAACRRPIQRTYDRYTQIKWAQELGTHTDAEWRQLLKSQDYRCYYCGVRRPDLVKDHRHPISRGGSDGIDNIAAACTQCNWHKGNKTVAEYFPHRRAV